MNDSRPKPGDAVVLWKRWRLVADQELYDLATDPAQERNFIVQFREVATALRDSFSKWWAGVEPRLLEISPIHLGSARANPVQLSPCDWVDVFFDQQNQVRRTKKNGAWSLFVEHAGDYEISLRRWPIEADTPIAAAMPAFPGVDGGFAAGDDSLGAIFRALQESGEDARTLIIFLSDHGMPLPFAKTQLYFHSTRTPLMVRWPGVTKPATVDDRHLVSAVDLLPTLLEIVAVPAPAGMDGRSFAPVLRGETQTGRDFIVAEYNENYAGNRHPMRSIITKDYGYLFNPWSNGTRAMDTATKGTATYRRMVALAKTDPAVAARLDLFEHRVPEELFNYATDPDALQNLVADPAHRAPRDALIATLDAWMVQTRDPMLSVFRARHDLAAREAYMKAAAAEADERKAAKQKGAGK